MFDGNIFQTPGSDAVGDVSVRSRHIKHITLNNEINI